MTKLTAKRGMAARTLSAAGARRPAVASWTPPVRASAYVAAKAVGSWVPKLTQKAFEKYGFSTAVLLTDWATIAGDQLAAATVPERVKWPRGVEVAGETDAAGGPRSGATLVLRVDPSRALDVEYKTQQIIDRINAYFGYRAIAQLRILQAPVEARVAMPPPRPRAAAATSGSAMDPLSAALARFEAGVMARAKSA